VLLQVAYDGRPFHGFAPQPDQRTVAGELLGALRAIDPKIVAVRGASRTDAGVHAKDQRVAFDPSRDFPLEAWIKGASRHLPDEIAIRAAWKVERGYDPRAHSRAKTYRYVILVDPRRDPFLVGRAWRVRELAKPGAVEAAASEAALAIGQHDFAAFRGASDPRTNTVRNLSRVEVVRDADDPRIVSVFVRGDAFLYNMVRILVGAIVDVGRGRKAPGTITRALASKDRRDLGITAPPDGLCLEQYEADDDDERRGRAG